MIFTSPSSAEEVSAGEHPETRDAYRRTPPDTDKSTRSHVACLISMRTVKPRVIAYAAVQVLLLMECLQSLIINVTASFCAVGSHVLANN